MTKIFINTAILIGLTTSLIAQPGDYAAFWNGNINVAAVDQTGNYNGVLQNGATYTVDRFGNENSAFIFDGVDDYIDLTNHDSYFKTLSTGTISLWFKSDATTLIGNLLGIGDDIDHYMSIGIGGNFSSWATGENFAITKKVGSTYNLICYLTNGHHFYNDNNWHHMALVVGSNFNKIYIDGTLQSVTYPHNYGNPSTGNEFLNVTSSGFGIGRRFYPNNPGYYDGAIDDLYIYDRPLSDTEIQQLFSALDQGPAANPNLSQEPIAIWNGESSAQDISGNNYHGTLENGATFTTDRFDNDNAAFSLDGVDDYIDLSIHDTYFKTLSNGTISLWFKSDATTSIGNLFGIGNDIDHFMSVGIGGNFSSWVVDESFAFTKRNGSTYPIVANLIEGHHFYNDNKWHHLVLSTGSGSNKIYIDGVLLPAVYPNNYGSSDTGNEFLNVNSANFGIGRRFYPGSPGYFKGAIDDIQIYNRPISANEVEKLYLGDAYKIWQSSGDNVYLIDENVGIGTDNPDSKLTVKGTIHAQRVKVDLQGAIAPDFVFEDEYSLRSLEEVELYIDKYKHLPEVPSANEMDKNGFELMEMNLLLLQKIEELTLHMIELKKEVETLKAEN